MADLLPGTPVELKVPARAEFIGTAKRVGTSLGGQMGFGLDEIDELGIAVVQGCSGLIEAAEERWGDGATMKVTFTSTESGLTVDLEAIAPGTEGALFVPRQQPLQREAKPRDAHVVAERELAQAMIRLWVDDFRHQVDAGRRLMHYRMVKYRVS
ncbi:MAG: hypothetical protein M3024_03365 [Candidatus Dormibacteraeota bacterium]|nr:hypothetical protein [Candidatus Dormibacteraeota bacterium]